MLWAIPYVPGSLRTKSFPTFTYVNEWFAYPIMLLKTWLVPNLLALPCTEFSLPWVVCIGLLFWVDFSLQVR
jgi:hypothetical protein